MEVNRPTDAIPTKQSTNLGTILAVETRGECAGDPTVWLLRPKHVTGAWYDQLLAPSRRGLRLTPNSFRFIVFNLPVN